MRPRLLAALTLVLSAALVLPASATAAGTTSRPATRSTRQAERALARAEAVFTPVSRRARTAGPVHGRDATMVLRDLALRVGDLPAADRRTAHAILARPTDSNNGTDGVEHRYKSTPRTNCTEHFCVHWIDPLDAPDDTDAVVRASGDTASVPAWVQTTEATLEHVWTTEVTDLGFHAPRPDTASPTDGTDPRVDVYLEELGDQGVYGYCTSDQPQAATKVTVSAYCVLDNDFASSEFHAPPVQSLEVTTAHEFFHAVQFGYDWQEDLWLMEGTAAWMEDEVYDDVNDNYQYLSDSPLHKPWMPLDYWSQSYEPYGAWTFWKFLSEDFPKAGPGIIRQVWEAAAGSRTYSTAAVKKVLAAHGTDFTAAFRRYGVWNGAPAKFYSEGRSYPAAPDVKRFRLTTAKPGTGTWRMRLDHMTTAYLRYTPDVSLKGRWRLRVRLDMPYLFRGSAAALTTHLTNGRVLVRNVHLDPHGDGSATVDFSRASVSYVTLSLADASTRFTCWQGTSMSCQGNPMDDGLPTYFRATAIR